MVSNNKRIIAAILKNGPKGKIWLSLFFKLIIDVGKAIIDPIKIVNKELGNPSTIPNISNNLISPPPIDSFLKIKSPSNFINNIIINDTNPPNNELINPLIPFKKYISNGNWSKMTSDGSLEPNNENDYAFEYNTPAMPFKPSVIILAGP